ncbi:hypothetical protein Y032_0035g3092 [Ancylostoma ceylanicum]|uniref:Serine carboxypeptidase S28 n=1 Tax=Ancylostoma ceylanicum TaxID=53326 RepID=A0A016UKV3_9BILA|nr:hypothetical protein Y032_0035g3092 [Ancylostoma ceylanicum]
MGVWYPKDAPVISFGGSYGGMLSAWFRIKYPHVVNGAWAASAPLIYFKGGGVDQGAFDAITTKTFVAAGCNRFIVANSWNAILNLSSTASGRDFLNNQFRIDPKSQINKTDDGWLLNAYFREAIEYMAMVDYPYPTGFLMPLPAWPVKVACGFMSAAGTNFSDKDLATMMYKASNVYYNSTGTLPYNCIDPSVCGDPGTSGLGNDQLGWPWQSEKFNTVPVLKILVTGEIFVFLTQVNRMDRVASPPHWGDCPAHDGIVAAVANLGLSSCSSHLMLTNKKTN